MLVFRPLTPVARLATALLVAALVILLLLASAKPVVAQSPAVPARSPLAHVTATPQPTATPRPNPTPIATPTPGGPSWPSIDFDPFALLGEHLQKALAELLATIIRPIRDALRQQLEQQFNILTVTRPEHTIGLAQVQQLHGVTRLIANGSIALILTVGGYNLMFRRHLNGDDSELWPLLGRLLLAALAANTAIIGSNGTPQGWSAWFIGLNNALIDATTRVLPISFDGLLAVGPADPLSLAAWPQFGGSLLLTLLILAVFLLVALLWLVQMLVRLALIDVLLAIVPLALVLWVLPQTEGWARLWWRVFLPTLFCQFLQVAVLGLGSALARTLARPSEVALAPLLGIAVLVLVLKIPGLLHADFGQGASVSGGVLRSLATIALIRRVAGRG